jgi:post-segregation antitoxin (ccd killing protein)
MFKPALMALCLAAAPACAQTEPDLAAAPQEQVLVVGKRPGPGLWKISKGDHVLWVFATYSPLPKKMEWRAHEVEAVLAQSQEYLAPPSATTDIGFFRQLTLVPKFIGLRNNPDGARLQDVLRPDVYARWLPLKAKYIGDDAGIERQRPFFAADTLYRKGLTHAGLAVDTQVLDAIENIVKARKIRTSTSKVTLPVTDPGKMLSDFKQADMDDAACFSTTLERLETDLDAMRARANAWAIGDLEAIRKLSFADREGACRAAMFDNPVMRAQPGLQSVQTRLREVWLASATKALDTNASTFAVLQLKEVLDPRGVVALLQAKGYQVEQPE